MDVKADQRLGTVIHKIAASAAIMPPVKKQKKRYGVISVNELYSILDKSIHSISVNGMFSHLLPMYGFLTRHAFKLGSLSRHQAIIEALGAGFQTEELTRWCLPTYQDLKWLVAAEHPNSKKHENTKLLCQCFQLLIVSYYSFHVDDKTVIKVLCQRLFYRFLKQEMFIFVKEKKKLSKLIRDYLGSDTVDYNAISLSALCRQHFKVIHMVINLKVLQKQFSVAVRVTMYLLQVLESLTRCLITLMQIGPGSSKGDVLPAYLKFYNCRSIHLNCKYIHEISEIISDKNSKVMALRLKIAIENILSVISQVHWNEIVTHLQSDKEVITNFSRYRMFIQSSILVTQDLELISCFQKTTWPRFDDI